MYIYTDGAARGNPGPAGYGYVCIDTKHDTAIEGGGRFSFATNNQMELTAVLEALRLIGDTHETVALYTDSKYVIQGMKQWVHAWQRNGWQTSQKEPVLNSNLWKDIVKLAAGKTIEWLYVPGHAGVPLNERVDTIATHYADQVHETLYNGSYTAYTYKHTDTVQSSIQEKKKKTSSAGYYVVVKNREVTRYETWEACKRAVHGIKGVKYKKVENEIQEKAFLATIGM